MKKSGVSNEYISAFCLQVSLLVHAGIMVEEGMYLLAEDEQDGHRKEMLLQIAQNMGGGKQLSDAMAETGSFPSYVIHMAAAGEKTGRVEQAFYAMSVYYENRRRMVESIKSAVLYPCMLLLLMLIVIGILLIKVLPIFNQVYEQLGGGMTGVAGTLLSFGQDLKKLLPVLGMLLFIVLVTTLIIFCHAGIRSRAMTVVKKMTANATIGKKINTSRFMSALSMGIQSGLTTEEALELAATFRQEEPKAQAVYAVCRAQMDQGATLAEVLRINGIVEPLYCRMLALGAKSGMLDEVTKELEERMEEEAQAALERLVNKIEPMIVVVASLLVGSILLAVMLPLMNIMSSIG